MTTTPDPTSSLFAGWETDLIAVDPSAHARALLVVPGARGDAHGEELDQLRAWGWTVTVAPGSDVATARTYLPGHDVALFTDIRGTSAARRVLTSSVPTVAIVPPRRSGRALSLLREAGTGRTTTVLIVADPRDAKILRRVSGSALVRPSGIDDPTVGGRAAALAAVLLRAHAWQLVRAGAAES